MTPEAAFTAWARAAAVSADAADGGMAALRAIVGDARIVAFGEGVHGSVEPLLFRNRAFEFLVDHLGFRAISIESGITEGFIVDRHVGGAEGDLDEVMERGFTFGFGELALNRELVRWMRERNRGRAQAEKLRFHGMDVPGRPTQMQSTLFVALDYLAAHAPAAAQALRARIEDLVPRLQLDRRSDRPGQYTELQQPERDRLSATIADLIATLAIHETQFARTSSDAEFDHALQAAIAARQVDDYLRQLPIGWQPSHGMQALAGTVAMADSAKAENIEWLRRQLGPQGKLMLFAHRDHLAGSGSTIHMPPLFDHWRLPPMVGEVLRRRCAAEMVSIAHCFAAESMGGETHHAGPSTIEGLLDELPADGLLLDLRTAPAAVKAWLSVPHELFGVPPMNTTVPFQAHDALFFTRQATPCSSNPEGHSA